MKTVPKVGRDAQGTSAAVKVRGTGAGDMPRRLTVTNPSITSQGPSYFQGK